MRPSTIDPRAIASLAVLRVNWDEEGRDYLENFSPFLVEALRASDDDRVSLPEVAGRVRGLVGFEVPQGVLKTLLRRAAKRGYVRKQHGVFHVDREALPSEPLAKREGDLRRECEALVGKLQAYAGAEFGVTWSGMEAERALLGVVEPFAASLLHAARRGDRPVAPVAEGSDLYVAASFVEHVYDRDPTAYAYLESVAKGAVLASAVYYEDPSAVAEKFDGLTAYLDTPLVLEALGVNGEQVRAPIAEMIGLMKEQGVEVQMLRRTFDETQGVLDAYGASTGDRRRELGPGPIRGVLSPSDARMLASRLDDRLAELGVRVVERPDFDARYSMDVRKLEDRLQDAVGYQNPGARVHDVEALVTVHGLRRGRRPSRLEKASAVFVTTNTTLARAAHRFFCDEYGWETKRAPVCVTGDDLATRLWLKAPNEAPELPTRQLLARAYAALQPSDALLEKYLSEAERLRKAGKVTERDYLLLRSSDDLLRRVTEATLNDPDAFTEGTLDEVREREMDAIRQAASARVERSDAARIEAERRTEALQSDFERAEADAAREAAERGARDAQLADERAKRERAEADRAALREKEATRRKLVGRIAVGVGTAVRFAVWALLFGLLFAGALLTIPDLPDWLTGVWRTLGTVAVAAMIAAALVNSFTDAGGWAARPAAWAERTVRQRLAAWLDLEAEGGSGEPSNSAA